jgi:hypothetical protein
MTRHVDFPQTAFSHPLVLSVPLSHRVAFFWACTVDNPADLRNPGSGTFQRGARALGFTGKELETAIEKLIKSGLLDRQSLAPADVGQVIDGQPTGPIFDIPRGEWI